MEKQKEKISRYHLQLPNDLDYIPPLRQFVSDIARGEGFPKKFCFRSEVIVDELCTNAVVHGSQDINGFIIVEAKFNSDSLELTIKNQVGSGKALEQLKKAIENPKLLFKEKRGRGIAIVQVLCNNLKIDIDKEGFTQVVVIKKNELTKPESLEDRLLYGRDL